jgi:hypothetical protein
MNPPKTEIAFSFTKNTIYSFNKLVKKECKAISYFNEDLLRPSFTGLEELQIRHRSDFILRDR